MMPMEWVEWIFDQLHTLFGKAWSERYDNQGLLAVYKTQWQTGLYGLRMQQIKMALAMCYLDRHHGVPSIMDFYHYAKGIRVSRKTQRGFPARASNAELATKYVRDIRARLDEGRKKKCYASR
jgi:hypothetical protein